eukprot:TRINITY_DN19228_c0_g1_i1.p1 TRINITY_DN19228_c0_g1~~TRINITY_DN19228_c0_g1_i1.p1  ORF type:complete len:103 (-),score=2.95 TRINITY_DN19228_c0_g1_i1:112-420(-)
MAVDEGWRACLAPLDPIRKAREGWRGMCGCGESGMALVAVGKALVAAGMGALVWNALYCEGRRLRVKDGTGVALALYGGLGFESSALKTQLAWALFGGRGCV